MHDTSSSASSASSASSLTSSLASLSTDHLPPKTQYAKFERYFKRSIKLGREEFGKDRSADSLSARTLNASHYFHLHGQVSEWLSDPSNAALFTDDDTYFYLAQMAATMQTVEIALALPHKSIDWPGAAPGPDPIWLGVKKHDVFCQLDRLICGGCNLDMEGMSWHREDNTTTSK